MAYPIRYRLLDKNTHEKVVLDDEQFIFIDGNGQPVIGCTQSFYPYFQWKSCSDYILEVATEKDISGKWIYKQIGH